ncbi:MAG: hypothetical protein U0P45_10670 [Acidimicrobiales bacterium]
MVDERRRGVLGLALALGAAATFLGSLVNAYEGSRHDSPSFGVGTSLDAGVDWGRFVKSVALLSSPVYLLFLVGAVVLSAPALATRSGRVACWIVVVVGMFVGVAAAGAVLVVAFDSGSSSGSVSFGGVGGSWYERFAVTCMYVATSFGAIFAAWTAWQALAPDASPLAQGDDGEVADGVAAEDGAGA